VTNGSDTSTVEIAVECSCDARARLRASAAGANGLPAALACSACGLERALVVDGLTHEHGMTACLACGHRELFTRKNFSRAAGLAVVIIAAVLAPWTHYLSLVAAAAIDWVLYRITADVVVCYVCGAEHRGFAPRPRHPRFDREIAERLRFGPRAVMGKPMRESGTANAPEPEH
jgi:hypothetical protein